MYILIFAKVFQTISTNGEGFNLAGTIEYIVFRTTKIGYLTTYSPATADFSIITALNACVICSCINTAARVAVFTATDASPNTSWFTLLQYTRTVHIVSYCTPCIEITYYSGTDTTHMRCIVRTTNNRIRIYWCRCRCWNLRFWIWSYWCNWLWSWSYWCNWLRIRSYWCNWLWIRSYWCNWFRVRSHRCNWFWIWSYWCNWLRIWSYWCNWLRIWSYWCNWLRIWSYWCNWLRIWSYWCNWFWFWHHIGALTITVFPSNITFFFICSQRFFVARHDAFRSDGYSTRKVSFTFYIVFIIELVGQVI